MFCVQNIIYYFVCYYQYDTLMLWDEYYSLSEWKGVGGFGKCAWFNALIDFTFTQQTNQFSCVHIYVMMICLACITD